MKSLIAILVVIAFLQGSIISLNLVLLILIIRAFIVREKLNLILAFAMGLLLSLLTSTPLGIYSLIYLLLVQLTHLISRTRLSGNITFILPVTLIFMAINELILSAVFGHSLTLWPKVLIEGLLSIPLFLVIKFWEERFTVKDLRLRI